MSENKCYRPSSKLIFILKDICEIVKDTISIIRILIYFSLFFQNKYTNVYFIFVSKLLKLFVEKGLVIHFTFKIKTITRIILIP